MIDYFKIIKIIISRIPPFKLYLLFINLDVDEFYS